MKHITSIELLENDYILIVCDDGKKYAAHVDLWYHPVSEIRPRFFRNPRRRHVVRRGRIRNILQLDSHESLKQLAKMLDEKAK